MFTYVKDKLWFVGLRYVFLIAMYSNSVNGYNLGNFFVTVRDDVTVRNGFLFSGNEVVSRPIQN